MPHYGPEYGSFSAPPEQQQWQGQQRYPVPGVPMGSTRMRWGAPPMPAAPIWQNGADDGIRGRGTAAADPRDLYEPYATRPPPRPYVKPGYVFPPRDTMSGVPVYPAGWGALQNVPQVSAHPSAYHPYQRPPMVANDLYAPQRRHQVNGGPVMERVSAGSVGGEWSQEPNGVIDLTEDEEEPRRGPPNMQSGSESLRGVKVRQVSGAGRLVHTGRTHDLKYGASEAWKQRISTTAITTTTTRVEASPIPSFSTTFVQYITTGWTAAHVHGFHPALSNSLQFLVNATDPLANRGH
ncbi:hypothetical protein HKX48_001229 [Thoreauomyces humboldtii]|nr:hypothetical protein HKX48_001229 [Thoreauomyces humboldtii]